MLVYAEGKLTEAEDIETQCGILQGGSLPPQLFCTDLTSRHRAAEQVKHRIQRTHNKDKSITRTVDGRFEADR
jgi:hypothetical protein